MAEEKNTVGQGDGSQDYQMNRKMGTIFMLISATGMGLVPLFSRWGTRTDMFDATQGLNGSDSIGAIMALGRMAMGVVFFLILMVATHKVTTFKKLKLTPAIALGGLMIGMSLACYVTSTLMTTVANAVMFIYTGPVICVLLARIFRKEPMSPLQWVCLCIVFVGMLFGESLLGFGVGGNVFGLDFNLAPSTPEFPQKMVGDIFGLLSGVFYGASMFFNGYRKDAGYYRSRCVQLHLRCYWCGCHRNPDERCRYGHGSDQLDHRDPLHGFQLGGRCSLWIVCGPIALGCLLVAGRNLPAMDYSTIAYWEVPVALFIGLVVFSEPVTLNTAIGIILIVGGGAFPTVKAMIQGSKMEKQQKVAEHLSERLEEEAAKEEER